MGLMTVTPALKRLRQKGPVSLSLSSIVRPRPDNLERHCLKTKVNKSPTKLVIDNNLNYSNTRVWGH